MLESKKAQECENRWRLEQAVHVSELRLQEMTQEAWRKGQRSVSPAEVARSLAPYQRALFKNGKVEDWDVTLCAAVLKFLRPPDETNESDAVAAIVAARNHCAHAAGGRVASAVFEQRYGACVRAIEALGGDAAALQQLRTCEIDMSDVRVLSCSQEATKAAKSAKTEGNRLFCANDFRAARECYAKGLRIAGAVDPMVLSQLFCNRSAAYLHLKDYTDAKEDAKRAAELAPQWSKPHWRLATIYHATSKHRKALARLEMAFGLATAADEAPVIMEIMKRMPEYRLRREEEARRESENFAYGPMHENEGAFRAANQARFGLDSTQDPMALMDELLKVDFDAVGMSAKKHGMVGQRARLDGRLDDAAREFLAAAVGGDPEGMYNYANCLLKGRGTRKSITEAIRWLEKAAETPPAPPFLNAGIGEAMTVLGSFHDEGIHFHQDKARAREYWERAADLGVCTGLNMFALCLMNGTHGVQRDLPRAREMFQRSANLLHNEAMWNLACLHASLHEYETAARWADAASRYGYLPAADAAVQYRELAALRGSVSQEVVNIMDGVARLRECYETSIQRQNTTPTLDELHAINTPYGKRLLAAKELMLQATQHLTSSDPATLIHAVRLAAEAYRIDDGSLVFFKDEIRVAGTFVESLQAMGIPLNRDMVLLLQPEASAVVTFWKSMQLQFPEDYELTRRAACAHMFTAYAGADRERGVQLFQRALGLLPHPDDDREPQTIGLLYEAAVAHYQTERLEQAEMLFTRFLKHAPANGHRKAAEAHFILGLIVWRKTTHELQGEYNISAVKKKAESAVAVHLKHGIALLEHVPPFLRCGTQDSPNRKALEIIMETLTGAPISAVGATSASPNMKKRGGELVPGPRRHMKIRCETSMLGSMWRKNIADMAAEVYNDKGHHFFWSTAPTRQSACSVEKNSICTAAMIDELFSALKDHVYTGRMIECIVVSVPSFNGSSFHFVVEDSQREPARVAVYNAQPLLMAQLVPGRAFRLLNPYVRLAADGSIMLRVDNPSSTIEVQTLHVICWVCAVEQQPGEVLRNCAKCHQARYCSKRCQTKDWNLYEHRYLCSPEQTVTTTEASGPCATVSASSFIFAALLITWKILLFLMRLCLSFLIRNVYVHFHKSPRIFGSVVVVLLVCFVIMPMPYLVEIRASAFYVFLTYTGMIMVCTMLFMRMMLAKILHLKLPEHAPQQDRHDPLKRQHGEKLSGHRSRRRRSTK